MNESTIRHERPDDVDAIRAVNDAAFGRPVEGHLTDQLRTEGAVLMSLVAEEAGDIVGHILFSRVAIEPQGGRLPAAILGPVAVVPTKQNQGIGSALVRRGLDECASIGINAVVLVGHPAYYPRFGFDPKLAERIEAPYEGPAFMAIELVPNALGFDSGRLVLPKAFRDLE
jgi:putative acetyltransferase